MHLPTTRWSLIARLEDPQKRASALEILCASYHGPVYAFLRRQGKGREEAEDLTQGFFELVVRDRLFDRANRETGKLRSFLLGTLENFVANTSRTSRALKRGGGQFPLSLQDIADDESLAALTANCATPEEAFDRAWLIVLIERVVHNLRQQYEVGGKGQLFSALLPWLMDEGTESQKQAAADAGTTVANFRVQLHRLRIRYRDALRQEIMMTVDADSADLSAEMEYFFSISRGWV